jgi:hypothetical protein
LTLGASHFCHGDFTICLQGAFAPARTAFICFNCHKPLKINTEIMAGLRHNDHGGTAEGIIGGVKIGISIG